MRKTLLFYVLLIGLQFNASAQCTTSNVNWDNLDFLVSTGNYAGFVSDAFARDQRFAFGRGVMRVQTASTITVGGDNITHTGETSAYGAGADIMFTTTAIAASQVTLSFSKPVTALRFSIFDLDNTQALTVLSYKSGAAVSTTLTRASSSSAITITGSPGTSPLAAGPAATNYTNTDNRGTVNVDVSAAVDSVVLRFTVATGDFWISDIQACVPGSFPTNYYAPSQPWPGQPSYILATSDTNRVHSIDPASGKAKEIFTESVSQYINSLAYDQNSKILFFTPDDVNAATTQKALMKYDFNTETMSTVVPDVLSLGIPYYESGVESGGAAFYDSCLYLGVEGSNPGRTSNRKSIIWRIAFDAAMNPIEVCQVFAITVDNGAGTLVHDWGDFAIHNGVLYNWNSRAISGSNKVYHYDLNTQILLNYTTTFTPKQNGITWNGTIYDVSGTTIRQYNGTTGLGGTAVTISGPNWTGGSGDGTEAFRPKADFGDAPASYDPASSPALHELDTALRLGTTIDREWLKEGATTLANSDGADEDGIPSMPLLCPCTPNFKPYVKVYNNTGSPATLIGWLDYDGDGVFEASEAVTMTINSSPVVQTVLLIWTNANTTLAAPSTTYLRIRLTSQANGMTTSNPSGYFANGEVEDYRVFVNGTVLNANLQSFNASKTDDRNVQLVWTANEDQSLGHYFVQKSTDKRTWKNIYQTSTSGSTGLARYAYNDPEVRTGATYYRVEVVSQDGSTRFSDVRQIVETSEAIRVWPNPARSILNINLNLKSDEATTLRVLNEAGVIMQSKGVQVRKGANMLTVDLKQFAPGIYHLQIKTADGLKKNAFVKE